jgi:1-pyrroline-5-carboxylate dehydrogenase
MSAPAKPRAKNAHATHTSQGAAQPAVPSGSQLSGVTGVRRVPPPVNEPIKGYVPGSPERAELKARLKRMSDERVDIPIVIGGREIRTGDTAPAVMPHAHHHVLGDWHRASRSHVSQAIDAAIAARREWGNWAWEDRAAVFLKAAELLATTWRSTLNAATMLGRRRRCSRPR